MLQSRNKDPKSARAVTTPIPLSPLRAILLGFESVAENLHLLILPILLDLFLWLGPHLQIHAIVKNFLRVMQGSVGTVPPDVTLVLTELADRWNVLQVLSVPPFGFLSLLLLRPVTNTPIGEGWHMEISSEWVVVGLVVAAGLVGMALATIYFQQIASVTARKLSADSPVPPRLQGKEWLLRGLNLTAFSAVATVLFLVAFLFPFSVVLSALSIVSPALASVGVVLALVIALLVASFFIFCIPANASERLWLPAMVGKGVHRARARFRDSAWLLNTTLLLGSITYQVWAMPAPDSWLFLVGIVGNAFVHTALTCSFFLFYQDQQRTEPSLLPILAAKES